jgi:hypothetical protein
MNPLHLDADQIIDIGSLSPILLTVVSSERDGLNPFCARVVTVESEYALLIPIDAKVKVVTPAP